MIDLETRSEDIRSQLEGDFPFYAQTCLRIRAKEGGILPFELNTIQHTVHNKLERQREETGRIRALILKARQPGISTYVEGRYYWRVTHRDGVRAFILTHKQEATDNLFTMVDRFHEMNDPEVRPVTGRSNAKELSFHKLNSGYKVGTAGARGVGRSDTIQYFHGSEVAYWETAPEHVDGVLQAVPEEDDTEVILESTANGLGGLFYQMCKAAERGDSDYQLIFIAWFMHEAYKRALPADGWDAPEAFREYQAMHSLTDEQTYWAYAKNRQFAQALSQESDDISWKFRQEYPATAEEAFQTGGDQTFIRSDLVYKARKLEVYGQEDFPIILGVDLARGGSDKTRLLDRQGRKCGGHVDIEIDTDNEMDIVGLIGKQIERVNPAKVLIDVTGMGGGVRDRLRETHDPNIIDGIEFGSKALNDETYANKRAEMWGDMRDWIADPAGVDIPDDDSLHTQLCAPIWGRGATRYDSNSRILLEPKDRIKERLGFSPDGGDALALTFAMPVTPRRSRIRVPTDAELGIV